MTGVQVSSGCRICGGGPADFWVGGQGPLCGRCSDDLIAAATGMPRLPDAPPPIMIDGPDGRRHVLRYRIWRAPTGILTQLLEQVPADGEGFEFAVLGDHDADVGDLVARVRAEAEIGIGRCYLEPGPRGWQVAAGEVAGRFAWDPDGGPHRVVVDGRPLSWEELGEALRAFEGWRFRLVIEDPSVDGRPDAVVLPLRRRGSAGSPG